MFIAATVTSVIILCGKAASSVARPEGLWKICIIHDADHIFSSSGLLFSVVNKGYFVLKTRIFSLSQQFVFLLFFFLNLVACWQDVPNVVDLFGVYLTELRCRVSQR